jgi:hypothetical protein
MSLSSLETGLLYACLLFVTTFLEFRAELSNDGLVDGTLAFGLTDPTNLSTGGGQQYISGVMYQLCGIFSVSIKATTLSLHC